MKSAKRISLVYCVLMPSVSAALVKPFRRCSRERVCSDVGTQAYRNEKLVSNGSGFLCANGSCDGNRSVPQNTRSHIPLRRCESSTLSRGTYLPLNLDVLFTPLHRMRERSSKARILEPATKPLLSICLFHRSDPRKELVYLSHLKQLKYPWTHPSDIQPNSSALAPDIVADNQPKPRGIHIRNLR